MTEQPEMSSKLDSRRSRQGPVPDLEFNEVRLAESPWNSLVLIIDDESIRPRCRPPPSEATLVRSEHRRRVAASLPSGAYAQWTIRNVDRENALESALHSLASFAICPSISSTSETPLENVAASHARDDFGLSWIQAAAWRRFAA
jgi:hypothetical protein